MATEVLVLTRTQFEKALRYYSDALVREFAPKFRLDERDRPSKAWLTNAETMEYLALSRPTLARYRADGRLPFSKIGSSIFYRLEDVEALLESGMNRNGADH